MLEHVVTRLHRLAVRVLLPTRLRADHADQIESDFRDLVRDAASRGPGGVLTATAREIADLARARSGARRATGGSERRRLTDGGGGGMEAMLRDARLAARALVRRPGFTAVAVASLALGIGGTTAMFALVNGVLVRPLAFGSPDRLFQTFLTVPALGMERGPVSYPIFDEWRERTQSVFESLSAFQPGLRRALVVGTEARLVSGTRVSGEIFSTLGRSAMHGRTLTPEDERPGSERVVVLSSALWTEAFGADPAVVGTRIALGSELHTVVGVMPEDFPGLWSEERFWVPFADVASMERDANFLRVIGRLRPGLTRADAVAGVERVVREQESEGPLGVEDRSVRMASQAEVVTGDVRLQLLVLMGAVVLLLAIACANLAGLLLVRGAARGRDLALREALGAGRGTLVRELLTESILLAAVGALLAVPVARVFIAAVSRFGPSDLPRLGEVRIDPTAVGFCVAAAFVCALASGVVPALRATRTDLRDGLSGGGTAGGPSRLQRTLVIGQIAVATVLVTGAGLLGTSMVRLEGTETGFESEGVATFRVSPPAGMSEDEVEAFHARILDGLEALPGVTAAGATWALPLGGMYGSGGFRVEGRPDQEHTVEIVPVLGDYFDAMRMRVVRGRALAAGDGRSEQTPILVGEALAERAWPNEDPIGKRLLEEEDGEVESYEVVGVVADVTLRGPGAEPELLAYWPHGATPWALDLYYAVRTSGDPAALVPAARALVASVDDRVPLADVSTMEARMSRHLERPRFRSLLAAIFATGAAGLSLLGIYGVTSFAVGRRTREIGVRMALGEGRARVLTSVLRGGLALSGVGVLLGLGAAAAGSRVLESLLYRVAPLEPGVYGLVAVAVLSASALACWLPARRAATVSPTTALRAEH